MKLIILFGGASYEHEISIVSAITLKDKLKNTELEFIFCDQDHTFYLISPSNMKAKFFSSGGYKKEPKLNIKQNGFIQNKMFGSVEYNSVVLNLIHGADGEDGTISSLLDFFGIRYIGPRVDAAIFSYDKRYTKALCNYRDIKTLKYDVLYSHEHDRLELEYPVIVKPSRLGSSIGVSVVHNHSELDYALDVAFEFDKSVVVEPFIDGVKEYNLAGFMADGKIEYSIVEEPKKEKFLDFDKKYLDFSRSSQVQKADITQELELKLKSAFDKIYNNLFDGALIRCDFFVINGEVYLNEINPIPGSMANYLFENFEDSIKKLANSIVEYKKIKIDYTYINSISAAKGK